MERRDELRGPNGGRDAIKLSAPATGQAGSRPDSQQASLLLRSRSELAHTVGSQPVCSDTGASEAQDTVSGTAMRPVPPLPPHALWPAQVLLPRSSYTRSSSGPSTARDRVQTINEPPVGGSTTSRSAGHSSLEERTHTRIVPPASPQSSDNRTEAECLPMATIPRPTSYESPTRESSLGLAGPSASAQTSMDRTAAEPMPIPIIHRPISYESPTRESLLALAGPSTSPSASLHDADLNPRPNPTMGRAMSSSLPFHNRSTPRPRPGMRPLPGRNTYAQSPGHISWHQTAMASTQTRPDAGNLSNRSASPPITLAAPRNVGAGTSTQSITAWYPPPPRREPPPGLGYRHFTPQPTPLPPRHVPPLHFGHGPHRPPPPPPPRRGGPPPGRGIQPRIIAPPPRCGDSPASGPVAQRTMDPRLSPRRHSARLQAALAAAAEAIRPGTSPPPPPSPPPTSSSARSRRLEARAAARRGGGAAASATPLPPAAASPTPEAQAAAPGNTRTAGPGPSAHSFSFAGPTPRTTSGSEAAYILHTFGHPPRRTSPSSSDSSPPIRAAQRRQQASELPRATSLPETLARGVPATIPRVSDLDRPPPEAGVPGQSPFDFYLQIHTREQVRLRRELEGEARALLREEEEEGEGEGMRGGAGERRG